jgi:endonuclease/exonuclease/phosphatase (EEP) superfamily protein YafD
MPGRLRAILEHPRLRRAVLVLSVLYAAGLVLTIALLRFVGERWWFTAVLLYLPRPLFLAPLPIALGALLATGQRRPLYVLLAVTTPLAVILLGFVFPWPAFADAKAPSIRVLSYNVNSCYGGVAEVVAVIDQYSPDVVMLEEVGQTDVLAPMLQQRYATVRVDTQFVVATRFPVVETVDPNRLGYNGRQRSPRWLKQTMQTPLGPIAFFVVHPLSPREGFYALRGHGLKHELLSGRLFTGANKDVLVTNTGLRALQVADFAEAARAETLPVVIGGDTNLPGLSYLLNSKLSAYQDGFRSAGWGLGYTFPTTHVPWMRIDRVLASETLHFVGFQVGRSKVSDHDCVVADLQLGR